MEMTETKEYLDQLIKEYLSMLWRQKLWFFVPLVSGIALTFFVILVLPRTYRSTTLLFVEGQKIPEDYAKSAASATGMYMLDTRFTQFQELILSRSLLQKVIEKFGLDNTEFKGETLEDAVALMKKNIEVKTFGRRGVDAFSLSYMASEPLTTMNVTNEIAAQVVRRHSEFRLEMVEKTRDFIEKELKDLLDALGQQESKLGAFKQTYMGMLPTQLEGNVLQLALLRHEIELTQVSKKTLLERKAAIEELIGRSRGDVLPGRERSLSRIDPTLLALRHGDLSPLLLALIDKIIQLENLQGEYKGNYPDILILKREIAALQSQLPIGQLDALIGGGGAAAAAGPAGPIVGVVDGHLPPLQLARIELAGVEEREKALEAQIRFYTQRIENTPVVEQEFVALQRDHDLTQRNYNALFDKKQSAAVSESVEAEQAGERFRILDYANLPETPIKPKPVKIAFIGLGLSLAGGIGIAFVRDKFDRTIRKPVELERVTGAPVLAYIPDFYQKDKSLYGKYYGKSSVEKGTNK